MVKSLKRWAVYILPYAKDFKRFLKTKQQASYLQYLTFKLGFSKTYWPQNKNCTVANIKNIYLGINSFISRPGNYIQGAGGVYIGNYVRIAPNVGILSSNHDIYDHRKSIHAKIIIGDYSWIGMNSVILPGVKLGTRTIVAAGSVVTKSFPQGYCVIAGIPAKIIKELDRGKFVPWVDDEEFYGFIPKDKFERMHFDIVEKLRNEIDTLK